MSKTMIDEETIVDADSRVCPKCGGTTTHQSPDKGADGKALCLQCGEAHGADEEIEIPQDTEDELLISAEDLSEQEDAVEDGDPDEQLMAVREGLARDEEPPAKVADEAPPPKPKPKPKPKRKRAKSRKKSEVEERLAGIDPATLPPYRTSSSYQVDDYFNHPKFGIGQVVEIVDATKIQVVFCDGKRLMLQGRHAC